MRVEAHVVGGDGRTLEMTLGLGLWVLGFWGRSVQDLGLRGQGFRLRVRDWSSIFCALGVGSEVQVAWAGAFGAL